MHTSLLLFSLSTAALGLASPPHPPQITPAPKLSQRDNNDDIPRACIKSRFADCLGDFASAAINKCAGGDLVDAMTIASIVPGEPIPEEARDQVECACEQATSLYNCYTKECGVASDFPTYYSVVEMCAATLSIGDAPAEPTGEAAKLWAEYNGEEVEVDDKDSGAASSFGLLSGSLGTLAAFAFGVGWFVGA